MMRKLKKNLVFVLAMVMVLSLTACGNDSSSKPTTAVDTEASVSDDVVKIRVATLAQQLSIPMYYIHEMGWDVENGFELEILTFSQGSGINEALGSGLVDVCTIGGAAVTSLSVYDAVYLFSHENSGAGQETMIRSDSDIAQVKGYLEGYPDVYGSPDTIKDKTILVQMGTSSQQLVDVYLQLFGLSEDDVTLVNMDNAPGYQAFVSGQGDFCKTAYPTTDEFDRELYTTAFSMDTLNVPYYDNIVLSRECYEDESMHDAIVALCVQLIRAADTFKDDEVLLDTMMAWYELNGQTVDRETITHQVIERPFFTYEELCEGNYSHSLTSLADFYESIGSIDSDALAKVYSNIDDTIMAEVLEVFAAAYR